MFVAKTPTLRRCSYQRDELQRPSGHLEPSRMGSDSRCCRLAICRAFCDDQFRTQTISPSDGMFGPSRGLGRRTSSACRAGHSAHSIPPSGRGGFSQFDAATGCDWLAIGMLTAWTRRLSDREHRFAFCVLPFAFCVLTFAYSANADGPTGFPAGRRFAFKL